MGVRTGTSRLGRALQLDPPAVDTSNYKYWVGNGANTTWTTSANWSNGVPANDTTTNIACFDSSGSYTRQPSGSSNAIKGLVFTGSATVGFVSTSLTVGQGGITVGSNAGSVTIYQIAVSGDQTWSVASGKTLTHSGLGNTGSGNITKVGAGAHTISTGSSSYTGIYKLQEGTLNVNTTSSPWGTQALEIYGGIIDNTSGSAKTITVGVNIYGDFTYGTSGGTSSNNISISGATSLTGGTRTITCLGGGTLTLASLSNGTLIKRGSGALVINGSPTFSGGATVYEGSLTLPSMVGNSMTVTIDGGTYMPSNTGSTSMYVAVTNTVGSTLKVSGGISPTVQSITFAGSNSKLVVWPASTTSTNKWTSTNAVSLNGVTIDVDQVRTLNPGTYTIFTATGGLSGSATKGVGPSGVADANWSLSVSGNNLRITVV